MAHVDVIRVLLIKLALIVAASGFFIRFRALRWVERNDRIARDLFWSRLELAERLACAAEYRDDATGVHNHRIGRYSEILARSLGVSKETLELIYHAAVLHDVGKIGVPDAVLLKPAALSPEERRTMERHAEIGGALLSGGSDPLVVMAHRIALSHHENWDGTGYPSRLKGEEIPLEGRIVAICDVFDALTSERPYKSPWPTDEALGEIRRLTGTKFDPKIAEAFFACQEEILSVHADPHAASWTKYRTQDDGCVIEGARLEAAYPA